MTPIQLHLLQWKDCKRCEYSNTRNKIVLGKGDIPCDILMVGEAPGPSEDMLGLPFIGKAGKILDRIINKVFGPVEKRKYRIAYNNIVACIPLIREGEHEKEEPDAHCIEECKPRLEEFIRIASPRLIVAVGKLSMEWLDKKYKHSIKYGSIPIVTIQHPASILRMPAPAQPTAEHRAKVIIASAVTEYLESK